MRWPFSTPKAQMESSAKNAIRDLLVLESQQALLKAATETANAANYVTHALKARIEDSIAQFENTARILNDALVICDVEGHIQAFNPAAERMFGISADSARSTFVGDLLVGATGEDNHAVWELVAKLEDDDEPCLLGRFSDGSQFPIEVNHTRLDRQDGTSIVLLVIREIRSDHDNAQINLKNYRSTFENSFDGIIVAKGQSVLAANPAASNLFGYGIDELMSKPLESLIMLGKETDSEDMVTDIQAKGKHHDGHTMEMAFTTTTIWWNGEAANLITIKNVTPTNCVTIPNMICCFNGEYQITFVNGAFASFYGSKREALMGKDIRTLLPAEEIDLFIIHINSLNGQQPTRRMQLRTIGADGLPHLQVWTDHATFEEDGTVEYQRIGHNMRDTKPKEKS
jgi:PAS domain S-box-containing protein